MSRGEEHCPGPRAGKLTPHTDLPPSEHSPQPPFVPPQMGVALGLRCGLPAFAVC